MTPARGESHFTAPGISPRGPKTPRARVGLNVFPSRTAIPSLQRGLSCRDSARPPWETRGPSRPNEPPHAGGAVPCLSGQGAVSARDGPARRTLLPTLRSDSGDGGEPLHIAGHQPLEPEAPRAFACARRVGNLNVFPSRAALPSLQRSPRLRAWRLPGEAARAAASTTPSRGRGSPLADIRAHLFRRLSGAQGEPFGTCSASIPLVERGLR